ncbi:MAG: hypothetical protein LBB17_01985, partial [Puniceicoccales bacterium]|nr:hypothetical protein [Puniceicoccales bacterium]
MDTQPLNPREGNENPQDPVSPYVPVRVPRDLRNIFDPKTSCISLGNRLTKAIAGHGTNEAASLVQLMRNGRLGFVPTPKESQAIGQRLSRDEDGMMLLARLIFDGKLSNFVPAPKESQAIVQ